MTTTTTSAWRMRSCCGVNGDSSASSRPSVRYPRMLFFFAFYGRHHRQLMNNSGSCPSGMNLCPASARLAKGDASLAHDGDASWEHRVPVGAAATFRSLTRPHSRHLAGWLAHLLRLTGSRARPHRFLRAPVIQLVVE